MNLPSHPMAASNRTPGTSCNALLAGRNVCVWGKAIEPCATFLLLICLKCGYHGTRWISPMRTSAASASATSTAQPSDVSLNFDGFSSSFTACDIALPPENYRTARSEEHTSDLQSLRHLV